MAVNYDPEGQRFVSDMVTIQRWATTEVDRRAALIACLDKHWANRTIGCLERIENASRWGWAMYPYRAGTTGPPPR